MRAGILQLLASGALAHAAKTASAGEVALAPAPLGRSSWQCSLCKALSAAAAPAFERLSDSLLEVLLVPLCVAIHGGGYCSNTRDREALALGNESNCEVFCRSIVSSFIPRYREAIEDGLQSSEVCDEINQCPEEPLPPVSRQPLQLSNLSDTSGEKDWPAWHDTSTGETTPT